MTGSGHWGALRSGAMPREKKKGVRALSAHMRLTVAKNIHMQSGAGKKKNKKHTLSACVRAPSKTSVHLSPIAFSRALAPSPLPFLALSLSTDPVNYTLLLQAASNHH